VSIRPELGRRSVLLIASVLVAALGVVLIWIYVRGADQRATENVRVVEVFVAAQDIPAGTSALEALPKVTIKKMFAGGLPADALRASDGEQRLQALGGKTSIAPIRPDQVIRSGDFETGTAQSSSLIPKGHVGVTVQVSEPGRAASLLKVGDQVAVYVAAPGNARAVVSPVEVLSIGSATVRPGGPETGAEVPPAVVGLALTPAQVKLVLRAAAGDDGITLAVLGRDTAVPGEGLPARTVTP
jgi:pilus assembly protein CpaB